MRTRSAAQKSVWLLTLVVVLAVPAAALDNFKCYKAKDLKDPKFAATTVALADQFAVNDGDFEVKKPSLLCVPVDVNGSGTANPDELLTCYKSKGPKLDKNDRPRVEITNQFGTAQLEILKPASVCVASHTRETLRNACEFGPGDLPSETLGPEFPKGGDIPIEHVILVMQENRSFDHYFGRLPAAGHTDVDGIPVDASNPDALNQPVYAFHTTQYCIDDVARGELAPLPRRVFPVQRAVAAFRHMEQARHTGKIVLEHPPRPAAVREDGTYLIVGGLGGLGLAVAGRLVELGARYLALMGRRPPDADAEREVARLRQAGAKVLVHPGDVSRADDVRAVLARIAADMPALLCPAPLPVAPTTEARESIDQAFRAHAEGSGDLSLRAELLLVRAALECDQRRFSEALGYLHQAKAIYRDLGDRHLEGRVLISEGIYVHYWGFPQEAIQLLRQGLDQLEVSRDPDDPHQPGGP